MLAQRHAYMLMWGTFLWESGLPCVILPDCGLYARADEEWGWSTVSAMAFFFSEVISKAKHCSPVDVFNIRALQLATPGNMAWFWHRMLKRRYPRCDLSSQCLSVLGLGAVSSFLATVCGKLSLRAVGKSLQEGLGRLQADMAVQACGTLLLPSPPWLLCKAGQQHWEGWKDQQWPRFTSPASCYETRKCRTALRYDNKTGCAADSRGGVRAGRAREECHPALRGDPPHRRCAWEGLEVSWRPADKVPWEINVDRTNKTSVLVITQRFSQALSLRVQPPPAMQYFFQFCSKPQQLSWSYEIVPYVSNVTARNAFLLYYPCWHLNVLFPCVALHPPPLLPEITAHSSLQWV